MIHALRRLARSHIALLGAVLSLTLLATACGGSDATSTADAEVTESTEVPESTDAASESSDSESGDADGDDHSDDAMDDDAMSDDAMDDDAMDDEPDDSMSEDATTSAAVDDEAIDVDSVDVDSTDDVVTDTEVGPSEEEVITLLGFMGITNPEEALECIGDEAESEGMTLETVMGGQGNAIMIAAFRCRPEEMTETISVAFAEIDSSAMSATPDQLNCGFETLVGWFPTIPLADADEVFAGDAPDEIIDLIADTCGMSREDADIFMNDA